MGYHCVDLMKMMMIVNIWQTLAMPPNLFQVRYLRSRVTFLRSRDCLGVGPGFDPRSCGSPQALYHGLAKNKGRSKIWEVRTLYQDFKGRTVVFLCGF